MTAKERWIIIIGRSITENSSTTKPLQPSTNSNRTAIDRESDTLLAVQELETQNQQQQQQQQIGPFVKMGWAVGARGERGVIKRHPLLGAWPVPHPFPDAVSLIFVFLSFSFSSVVVALTIQRQLTTKRTWHRSSQLPPVFRLPPARQHTFTWCIIADCNHQGLTHGIICLLAAVPHNNRLPRR